MRALEVAACTATIAAALAVLVGLLSPLEPHPERAALSTVLGVLEREGLHVLYLPATVEFSGGSVRACSDRGCSSAPPPPGVSLEPSRAGPGVVAVACVGGRCRLLPEPPRGVCWVCRV